MDSPLPRIDRHGLSELALRGLRWSDHTKRFESDELGREPLTEMQARYLLWAWENGGTRHPNDPDG